MQAEGEATIFTQAEGFLHTLRGGKGWPAGKKAPAGYTHEDQFT